MTGLPPVVNILQSAVNCPDDLLCELVALYYWLSIQNGWGFKSIIKIKLFSVLSFFCTEHKVSRAFLIVYTNSSYPRLIFFSRDLLK